MRQPQVCRLGSWCHSNCRPAVCETAAVKDALDALNLHRRSKRATTRWQEIPRCGGAKTLDLGQQRRGLRPTFSPDEEFRAVVGPSAERKTGPSTRKW